MIPTRRRRPIDAGSARDAIQDRGGAKRLPVFVEGLDVFSSRLGTLIPPSALPGGERYQFPSWEGSVVGCSALTRKGG